MRKRFIVYNNIHEKNFLLTKRSEQKMIEPGHMAGNIGNVKFYLKSLRQ